jgi:hypothetical protein
MGRCVEYVNKQLDVQLAVRYRNGPDTAIIEEESSTYEATM